MLYVIIGQDVPNSLAARRAARAAHLRHLQPLLAEGRVVLAGPCPAVDAADPGDAGFTGSVLVVEFPTLADAQQWAAIDPYVTEGVFASYVVRPFLKVLP